MSITTSRPPARLPDATLRRSLEATVGPDAAAHAFQLAGHEAGDALFALLRDSLLKSGSAAALTVDVPAEAAPGTEEVSGESLAALDEVEFWRHLGRLFAERGWGEILFEDLHAGIGALESADWAEADPEIPALRPSCHFTVGLIANLLGRVAGAEVGVIESECRSRGDLRCRFLFGGRHALEQVYAQIREGSAANDLLSSLD